MIYVIYVFYVFYVVPGRGNRNMATVVHRIKQLRLYSFPSRLQDKDNKEGNEVAALSTGDLLSCFLTNLNSPYHLVRLHTLEILAYCPRLSYEKKKVLLLPMVLMVLMLSNGV